MAHSSLREEQRVLFCRQNVCARENKDGKKKKLRGAIRIPDCCEPRTPQPVVVLLITPCSVGRMRLALVLLALLLPAASCLLRGAASPRRAPAGRPAPRRVALRLVEPTPPEAALGANEPSDAAAPPSIEEPPPPSMEWEDFALNAGLFVSLHAFFLTGAALASGAPDGGTAASTAIGRGLGLAAFVALQQARGLPTATWLGQQAGQPAKQAPIPAVLASPLAPVGAVALFLLLTSAPALLATVLRTPTPTPTPTPSSYPSTILILMLTVFLALTLTLALSLSLARTRWRAIPRRRVSSYPPPARCPARREPPPEP